MSLDNFINLLNPNERKLFSEFLTPADIQNFLDSFPYVSEDLNRSPLRVMHDRQAHCLDGGLFAAAALWQIGYPPLILDLVPEPGVDDDHVLAIYRNDDLYGAVAKSNFSGLRFREPVYRSLRELVMSYFEGFFNVEGKKTLRAYTRPMDLRHYARCEWLWSEDGVEVVVERLYRLKGIPVLNQESIAGLSPMDKRSYESGMLGVNYDGLYKPH